MLVYKDLHDLFPTRKLARKVFLPRSKPNASAVDLMCWYIQQALLHELEESDGATKLHLTHKGICKLHRFTDVEGKVREFTFANNWQRKRLLRQLAKELQRIAEGGIDAQGHGLICVEEGDVVFVPNPNTPVYGNILLFDPYRKVDRSRW
jgi:hypothetical protein